MSLIDIIKETLIMMGFTFVVGIAFAYILKLMTLFFPRLDGKNLSWNSALLVQSLELTG